MMLLIYYYLLEFDVLMLLLFYILCAFSRRCSVNGADSVGMVPHLSNTFVSLFFGRHGIWFLNLC